MPPTPTVRKNLSPSLSLSACACACARCTDSLGAIVSDRTVKVFVGIFDLPPNGGATAVVPGTHRIPSGPGQVFERGNFRCSGQVNHGPEALHQTRMPNYVEAALPAGCGIAFDVRLGASLLSNMSRCRHACSVPCSVRCGPTHCACFAEPHMAHQHAQHQRDRPALRIFWLPILRYVRVSRIDPLLIQFWACGRPEKVSERPCASVLVACT